jgi:hypothetical protein
MTKCYDNNTSNNWRERRDLIPGNVLGLRQWQQGECEDGNEGDDTSNTVH